MREAEEEEGRKGAGGEGREDEGRYCREVRNVSFTVIISIVYHCVHPHLPHQLVITLSLAEGDTVVLVSPS